MKKIYTIPTPYGIETRTSLRDYTHIVVAGLRKESQIRDDLIGSIKHLKKLLQETEHELSKGVEGARACVVDLSYNCFTKTFREISEKEMNEKISQRISELEKRKHYCVSNLSILENDFEGELKRILESRKPLGLVGYAGSAQLARKLAGAYPVRYESYHDIQIIEITPDMIREIVSRKKGV